MGSEVKKHDAAVSGDALGEIKEIKADLSFILSEVVSLKSLVYRLIEDKMPVDYDEEVNAALVNETLLTKVMIFC